MSDATEREIDLGTLYLGLRRYWLRIVLAALAAALLVWLWSLTRPPVFETSSSIIAAGSAPDGVVSRTLISAPPLPDGAVSEALRSPAVLNVVMQRLRANTALPKAARLKLADKLDDEMQRDQLRTLQVDSRLDPQQNGIYTVQGQAGSALLARTLVNTAVQALLEWDANRSLQGILKAQTTLRAQIKAVDAQLASRSLPLIERQSLTATRATTVQNLSQVVIAEQAATGTLSLVSDAVTPREPIAPKPLRNALLTLLLVLVLGSGLTALLVVTDRTVRSEEDLLELGVPTLGSVPRLRRRDILLMGLLRAARQSAWMEAVSFLRIDLLSTLQGQSKYRLLITSTAPGEGKSSMTAALADSLVSSGQRVLIIDADFWRSTQMSLWNKSVGPESWQQLAGEGGARTVQQALHDPGNVQVLEVQPGLHLLPAGRGTAEGALGHTDLGRVLDRWGADYDVVLVDSPPLLAVADGLLLAPYVDGMLMVAEAGRTSLQGMRRALRRAERVGVRLLGVVLNKVDPRGGDTYNYDYKSPSGTEVPL